MTDEAASKIVRQAIVSPITAAAMMGGLVAAGAGAATTYLSLRGSMDRLADRVVAIEAKETARDQDTRRLSEGINLRMGAMEKSLAGIEVSLRYLTEEKRRRPND